VFTGPGSRGLAAADDARCRRAIIFFVKFNRQVFRREFFGDPLCGRGMKDYLKIHTRINVGDGTRDNELEKLLPQGYSSGCTGSYLYRSGRSDDIW